MSSLTRRCGARAAALVAVLTAAACSAPVVSWDEPPSSASAASDLRVPDASGSLTPPPELGVTDSAPPGWTGEICPGSMRWGRGARGDAYAAWWSPRADHSVALMVSRVVRGTPATWMPPVAADATDRGTRGCDRPPIAITVDSATGWPHLAYFLEAARGAGLYTVHSMEQGRLFHEPVPILMGERPVSAAVASEGQTVVVAFDDPSVVRPQISVAVSGMGGHYFEPIRPTASQSSAVADPRVSVRGGRTVVAWEEAIPGDSGGPPRMLVREGEVHIPREHMAGMP